MRRFPLDFTTSVSVDGVVRDQRTVWAHQQSDPYPGGHRYEAVICGPAALEHFRGLPHDLTGRLDSRAAHKFLQQLYWTFEAPEEGVAWEFVLNTIDHVEATIDTLRISGECSPFVRASSTPRPGA